MKNKVKKISIYAAIIIVGNSNVVIRFINTR